MRSLTPTQLFQQIGAPQPVLPVRSARYQAVVYDVEQLGKLSIYKLYEPTTNQPVDFPRGTIVGRIYGVHNGVSMNNLPFFTPYFYNQNVPVIGQTVWLVSDDLGQWYWQGLVRSDILSLQELDEIERTYGRQKNPAKVSERVNLTKDVVLDPNFVQNSSQLDSKRQANVFPMPDSKLPKPESLSGDFGWEGNFGNGVLFSYGNLNNGITYLYDGRTQSRPTFNETNALVVAGSNYDIDTNLKTVAKDVLKTDHPNYLNNKTTTNFVVVNSNDVRINAKSGSVVIGGQKIASAGSQVIIMGTDSLWLKSDKNIKISVGSSEISIEKDKISVFADKVLLRGNKEINLNDGFVTIKTKVLRIRQALAGLMRDTFINLFNAHTHASIGSPPVPPIDPATRSTITTENELKV